MAKGNNAFDNLLASGTWAKPENRQAFESMVVDEPWLKEAVMLRSDYSRNLDEMRPKVEKADKWDSWMSENWDDEHGMTKAEYALQQRNAEIQRRLEAAALGEGADQVTFDELNTHLAAKVKDLGLEKFVAKDDLDNMVKTAKEEGVAYNNYTAHLATRATYLAVKHDKEFGELVDPNDIFKYANENKISDLDAAYDKMVSEKRKVVSDADLQKKLETAKEEGRKAALQERGMSEGSMPVDMGGPDMGHFAKKLMAGGDKSGSAVPDEVPLGSVASQAARIYEQRAIEGRNA